MPQLIMTYIVKGHFYNNIFQFIFSVPQNVPSVRLTLGSIHLIGNSVLSLQRKNRFDCRIKVSKECKICNFLQDGRRGTGNLRLPLTFTVNCRYFRTGYILAVFQRSELSQWYRTYPQIQSTIF